MIKKISLLFFAFTVLSMHSQGTKSKVQSLLEDVDYYIEESEHDKAYVALDEITKIEPNNYLYKFQKGVAALNLPLRKMETITLFEEIQKADDKDKGSLLDYFGKGYEKIMLYYLGRAYHENYRFDDAIKYFQDYIATNPADENMKHEVEHYLKYAVSAKDIVSKPVDITIKNIGPPVNTPAMEYVPVISADESVLIYTYRGPKSIGGLMDRKFKPSENGIYYEDIYTTKRINDSLWQEPVGISDDINTKQHDASIAMSADGQDLYTFRSDDKDHGDIYVCHLSGSTWSKPERLNENINTKYWEGSCSISSDGTCLYFSSERPNGIGARDLYVSTKQQDGSWGVPQNLATLNTEYNEDAPFIHPNGTTLFFSSEGHNSMGGYDIMYSEKTNGLWSEPVNMGHPLNTTDDDRYYVVSAKGDRGYFSSNRNLAGGDGSQDIYMVTPAFGGPKPILVMITGIVYANDTLAEAKVEIIKKSTGEVLGPYHSNATTGKFLVTLPSHDSYTFRINVPTFPEYTENLDADQLRKFADVKKEFHLEKDGFVDHHNDTIKKLNQLLIDQILDTITVVPDSLQTKPDTTTTTVATGNAPCNELRTLDFSALKGKSLNNPEVYAKLLQIGNKICAEKMEFKVQIGAYRHPENFNWNHLDKFGNPEHPLGPDGITRFTQGKFTNIDEAEKLRKQIIASGQKDAWITGFIDGKRYTLEELIMVDFYNKNIAQFNENLELIKDWVAYTIK